LDDLENSASPFSALGVQPEVLRALDELGYEEPTPIQTAAIPPLLEGRDVVGSAATGTGKTAAFAIPIVQGIEPRQGVQALVLAPTRELAVQVAEAIHRYGRHLGITVLPIYGGQDISRQLAALRRGVQVVVGTPGRVLDHLHRRSLDLSGVRYVVLDEADEMLDMGFIEDIDAILGETPEERQTALFSATFPPRIRQLADRHLRDPERLAIKQRQMETPLVRQVAYVVPRPHKLEALGRVLDLEAPTSAIIFCRTRTEVDELTEALAVRGYRPEALHGGLGQPQRDRVMARFREGVADLLVATDVAARGLDVEHVSHVINYDIPQSPEVYVHRIGRTGRAGREGTAITLVQPREHRLLKGIERVVGRPVESARIPTIADVRVRRLELLREELQELLVEDDFDSFRVTVQSLAEEFDAMDIAAAAVKLAAMERQGEAPENTADIPQWEPRQDWPERESRGPRGRRDQSQGGRSRGRLGSEDVTRIFIGVGRRRGIRPGDLVGAITGEAGVASDMLGAIQITDGYSLIEVPELVADEIIKAMKQASLRGKKVIVRRDRDA
jgi:ATP-dependent RNA helicase DeaD